MIEGDVIGGATSRTTGPASRSTHRTTRSEAPVRSIENVIVGNEYNGITIGKTASMTT